MGWLDFEKLVNFKKLVFREMNILEALPKLWTAGALACAILILRTHLINRVSFDPENDGPE